MKQSEILAAAYLDIVFEGRNKDYGAYQLRATYEKRMWKALLITLGIFSLFAGGFYLKNVLFKAENKTRFRITESVTIQDIKADKKEIPPPVELPKPVETPKIKTIEFVVPKVVPDKEVVTPPPTQTEIEEAKISNITTEGIKDAGVVLPPQTIDNNKGIIEIKTYNDDNGGRPFEKVEIDAKYPGGSTAWKNFLERNLRGDVPVENGASGGTFTVVIQFIVDKGGNLSDIKPLTNFGYGMEQEAIRVIKKSGKWIPAIQNGSEVTAYRKQPITFQVMEQ